MKTKLFTGYWTGEGIQRRFIDIDEEMNTFLENNNVELIDIKFASYVHQDEAWNSALIIYREIKE